MALGAPTQAASVEGFEQANAREVLHWYLDRHLDRRDVGDIRSVIVGSLDRGIDASRTVMATGPSSALTDDRLDLLYHGEGFGGDTTLPAKVVRELIDEIRALRRELAAIASPSAGD